MRSRHGHHGHSEPARPPARKTNLYAGGLLDRAGPLRRDATWLRAAAANPAARFLPVWRGQTLVNLEIPAEPRLVALTGDEAAPWRMLADDWALLGINRARDEEEPWFALDLSSQEKAGGAGALVPWGSFVELRTVGGILPAAEASAAAYARGLVWWHQRHRFCGVCGAPTRSDDGGHVRRCGGGQDGAARDTPSGCGADHFPRTDPAVIMLVHRDGHVLLGRQPRFPARFWSILAGFVEPGESLEEAVIREVREETGVEVGLPRYHSSQPWPFPSSLMLGFMVQARTTAITVQPGEMEDARWFTRAEIQQALRAPQTAPIQLPRRDSVARLLVETWAAGDEGGEG